MTSARTTFAIAGAALLAASAYGVLWAMGEGMAFQRGWDQLQDPTAPLGPDGQRVLAYINRGR